MLVILESQIPRRYAPGIIPLTPQTSSRFIGIRFQLVSLNKTCFFCVLTLIIHQLIMEEKKIKVGVISDTHLAGYDDKMRGCIVEHFSDVDIILHAGDMIDLSVLEIFGKKEVRAVCGNMDNISVRERFPEHLLFEIKRFKFLLIHGWGSPWGIEEKISARFKNVDCIVYGHTHKPANHKKGSVLFFNPGSAVDRYFASSRTIGILEIDKGIAGKIINI